MRIPIIVLGLLAALPAAADDWRNPPLEWRSPSVGPASDMWELARQQMILDEQRRRLQFDRSLEIQQLEREHRFRMERLQQEQRIESILRDRADRLRQEALRQAAEEKDPRKNPK